MDVQVVKISNAGANYIAMRETIQHTETDPTFVIDSEFDYIE